MKFFSLDGIKQIVRILTSDIIKKIVSELGILQEFAVRVIQLDSQFPKVLGSSKTEEIHDIPIGH
jgi:hypothetical protein